jgi:hypothetical protein
MAHLLDKVPYQTAPREKVSSRKSRRPRAMSQDYPDYPYKLVEERY